MQIGMKLGGCARRDGRSCESWAKLEAGLLITARYLSACCMWQHHSHITANFHSHAISPLPYSSRLHDCSTLYSFVAVHWLLAVLSPAHRLAAVAANWLCNARYRLTNSQDLCITINVVLGHAVGEVGQRAGKGHFWHNLHGEVARRGRCCEVCSYPTAGSSRELSAGGACAGMCATSQCHALLW